MRLKVISKRWRTIGGIDNKCRKINATCDLSIMLSSYGWPGEEALKSAPDGPGLPLRKGTP